MIKKEYKNFHYIRHDDNIKRGASKCRICLQQIKTEDVFYRLFFKSHDYLPMHEVCFNGWLNFMVGSESEE